MAAGLETAVDTRGGHSKLVGNLVEKVLLARQLAENERKFAAKKAAEAGTSLEEVGIEQGHFFKKALVGEFGGNYFEKKKKDLKNVVKKYKIAKRLTKDPKKAFKFVKPLLQKKVSLSQTKMFRAQFDYSYTDEENRPKSQTPIVGNTAKKIQKATGGKKRISNEELLKSLTSIAESLNKTAETIGRNTSGMTTGVISAVRSQHDLVEQLKLRNTSIEDKLDDIAKAISDQTQLHKKTIVKAKASKTEQNLESTSDIAQTEVADDTKTEVDETLMAQLTQNIEPTTNIINNQTLQSFPQRPSGGYPSPSNIPKAGMDIPGYEKGGVVSGPNSGYLAKVPKGSTIVPLNNNYTNGKPSAIDGKIRQKPQSTSSSVGGRFGFGITNMTGIAGGGTTKASKMAQPLIDAMSLPMIVTGGSILSTVTKLMQSMGSGGESIAPEIEKMTRSIADVFGLPPSIVKKIKGSKKVAGVEEQKDKDESKKNIMSRLMDGFGKLLEKMGQSINQTPSPTGQPQPADITGNEKELLKRLMIAEAGGEGIEGMAMVGQSVLNRASLIQSGTVGAGQFNAASGSVTDVIQGENQYQPYRQGKLNRALSAEENARAEEAYNLLKNMPEFKKRIKSAFNLSDRQVQLGAASTGFRNYDAGAGLDTSQQVNEFKAGSHTWNTAGNAGLKTASSNVKVNIPAATQQAAQPQAPQPVQKITQNFGYKRGDRVNFDYNGEKYHAYRDGDDWALFKGRGIGATLLDRSGGKNKAVVDQFLKVVQQQTSASNPPVVSFAPPSPTSGSVATAGKISEQLDNSMANNITALVLQQSQQPQPQQLATTVLPSTVETSTTGRGNGDLANSGLFNPNIFS